MHVPPLVASYFPPIVSLWREEQAVKRLNGVHYVVNGNYSVCVTM